MELTKKILNLNEGLTIYGQLLKDEEAILIPFTMSQYATVHTIVELLREYLADLERNECKEALCIDFDQMTSVDYWMEKLVKLRSDMERLGSVPLKEHGFVVTILGFTPQTTMDFYRAIEQKIVQMTEMLREVYRRLQENPSLFAAFYRFQKAACDARPVKARYRRWKREVGVVTPELLKDKEVYEIEKYLKMKILRHTLAPSDREVELVDLGKMNRHLPYGYVIPEDLKKCYARFLRYVKEDGDTLRIDHHLYGNYLFQHFNDLTPADRQAFIELDLMLELIHEDMQQGKRVVLPEALATPEAGKASAKSFDTDTPLSVLFRENHHEQLEKIIESWRPYLMDTDPDKEALQLSTFHFDLDQIQPSTVYLDFARLISLGTLMVPMSNLATYMFSHSNLSKSENALYVQLKRYKKMCEQTRKKS